MFVVWHLRNVKISTMFLTKKLYPNYIASILILGSEKKDYAWRDP